MVSKRSDSMLGITTLNDLKELDANLCRGFYSCLCIAGLRFGERLPIRITGSPAFREDVDYRL